MVEIIQADYKSDYVIHFTFSDGTSNDVDFWPFLMESQNSMVTRFRNLAKFRRFRIVYGRSIAWGDNTMSFPVESVYKTAPIIQPVSAEVADIWMRSMK